MRSILRAAAAAAVIAVGAAGAQASFVNLSVYENADNGDISGLDLSVQLIDQGTAVDVVFHNASTIPSVVTVVYFEATPASLGIGGYSIFAQSPGVNFAPGGSPATPAGIPGGFGGPWAGTEARFGATAPPSGNGISPGESLTIRIGLGSLSSFDIIEAIKSGDIRIAQHVQSVGPNSVSVWTVTTVPAPASLALLALTGVAGGRRRRRA